jgi:hypothetical protein
MSLNLLAFPGRYSPDSPPLSLRGAQRRGNLGGSGQAWR